MRVIITTGLSEIPVLAAAYCLCRAEYRSGRPIPAFAVLCSNETQAEALRVRDALAKRLGSIGQDSNLSWELINVEDAYDPLKIVGGIRPHLAKWKDENLHLHYTGGTAAMAVHPLKEIQQGLGIWPALSYLSSEDHLVRGEDGLPIATDQVRDERYHWQLSLQELIGLRGFELLPGTGNIPQPALIAIGCEMMDFLRDDEIRRQYQAWKRGIESDFKQVHENSRDRQWRERNPMPFRFPSFNASGWDALMTRAKEYFFPGIADPKLTLMAWEKRQALQSFINDQYLELFAYRAFQEALGECGPPATDLRHSARCKRQGQRQTFELDVTAVCGYELVMVSCSMTIREEAKRKAFEAAFRARQIGGYHVWPIVIAMDDAKFAKDTQDALQDHVGGLKKAPQVWCRDDCSSLDQLKKRFTEQLEKMQWTK
jgi:hypothetical protein